MIEHRSEFTKTCDNCGCTIRTGKDEKEVKNAGMDLLLPGIGLPSIRTEAYSFCHAECLMGWLMNNYPRSFKRYFCAKSDEEVYSRFVGRKY